MSPEVLDQTQNKSEATANTQQNYSNVEGTVNQQKDTPIFKGNWRYLFAGLFFGFVLVQAEVVSWFRIQEMFRFESFHMYGVIGMAVVVGLISIQLIKRLNLKDVDGNPITIAPKDSSQWKRYIFGGSIFGMGWALTGACPGPLFALAGAGYSVILVPIIGALAGTYVYGLAQKKLPH